MGLVNHQPGICAAEGEISDAFQIYEEMLAAGYETDPRLPHDAPISMVDCAMNHGDIIRHNMI